MQWNLQSSSWKKIKMERMKARQVLSITLTLFAVFFGAGNMIFPPAMGQQAGEHYIQALAGFIVTDAGIALFGMIAVVLVGTEVSDLGELVGRRFAIFLSVCIYLAHRIDLYNNQYDKTILYCQSHGRLFADSLSDMVYICRVFKSVPIHHELIRM